MNYKISAFFNFFLLILFSFNVMFAANFSDYLYKDFYKGEPLSKIKKEYPVSYFLSKKEKNTIINVLGLKFLKNLNFFKVYLTSKSKNAFIKNLKNKNDNKVILVLNPKEDNRVIAVILSSNKERNIDPLLKKIVKKNGMLFKKGYVFFSNGVIYNNKYFNSEKQLHNYLIDITIQLSAVKKGILYINENYESLKTHKGVVYAKLETVEEQKGCKICAYLGHKSFSKNKIVEIFIYKRK